MSEEQQSSTLQVTNPLEALTVIFYKPSAVFEALAVKNNWSWVPFIIIGLMIFFPFYLYYDVVNFDWFIDTHVMPKLEDMTPAQKDTVLAQQNPAFLKFTGGIVFIFALVINAIVAFYFSLVTKNDDKNVQGFTDWYGALFWIAMPSVLGSIIGLVLLTLSNGNGEILTSTLSPLSLTYILGLEPAAKMYDFLFNIRIDSIWSIWLTVVCIKTWTNFSTSKALIVAVIPTLVGWSISFAMTT